MKKSLLLFAALALSLTACKKDEPYMTDAVLTGYDLRNCACCGGLLLNMGNAVLKYSSEYYFVDQYPASFVIDSTTIFPVYVRISWKYTTDPPCGDTAHHITITSMERR
jgi:hypothetical protein